MFVIDSNEKRKQHEQKAEQKLKQNAFLRWQQFTLSMEIK